MMHLFENLVFKMAATRQALLYSTGSELVYSAVVQEHAFETFKQELIDKEMLVKIVPPERYKYWLSVTMINGIRIMTSKWVPEHFAVLLDKDNNVLTVIDLRESDNVTKIG